MIEAGTAIETVGHTSTIQTTNKIHTYTKNITHKHTHKHLHTPIQQSAEQTYKKT
jgi:hypothetical protein